ncbi:MAG TPA: NTPase [Methanothermobacter sp.]|nr:nucleoside-triphosphatase MTBMA_c14560 [Methanothermobacter sp. MT-2]HHW05465.1 NTPase [Methanothermobacter sp.]HOK73199.1 NTPase [Methanothermobacter sp.]HOL68853.1 NTPase [Methanothermobacter sp.]HPQ04746.1 NTPase [Methanothermobacter sp.]
MKNIIITGRPRSGKTTLIKKIKNHLEEKGAAIGGIFTPEIRKNNKRIGFKIIDIMTGEEGILAKKGSPGPRVGSYGVNIETIKKVGVPGIERAIKSADYILIDEVAPMELKDPNFMLKVEEALSSDKIVIAAFHRRLIQNMKNKRNIQIFRINPENRKLIYEKIKSIIEGK